MITSATIVLHSIFLRQERLSLIDQQVRETAAALIDSELGDLRRIDFAKADKIISEELGENRIGKFFIIRNQAGDVLFRSTGTTVVPVRDFPRQPQWLTYRVKRQYIRVLNLSLPRVQDRTLQVGVLINEDLISPNYISSKSTVFLSVILALGLIVSWFLTSTLMKPIRRLETFVSEAAPSASNAGELPPVPEALKIQGGRNENDEYRRLLTGLDKMISRVNRSYKLSRLWAYQMAHELKTPLAVLEVEVERYLQVGALQPSAAEAIRKETARVSETVNSFLDWAELENARPHKRLFANKAGRVITDIKRRLATTGADRIQVEVRNDFYILANPQHLEQAATNLISNALAYSPCELEVTVVVDAPTLTVIDRGHGIPKSVLDRLGEPFNRGHRESRDGTRGHGLGLAWVQSLARLYDWKVDIESDQAETRIRLHFPEEKK